MSMFEYGVNVANKFGSLSDDEVEDPEEILRKAEAASRKEERTASQKKADKNAAARKKKESAAVAAQNAAAREADAKKAAAAAAVQLSQRKPADPANKENRPDGERGRGRGRGRGGMGRGGRGGGGPPGDGANRFPQDQGGDNFGDRFGEMRGRGGRGRGGRGRASFRGGRGGAIVHPMDVDHDQNADDTNVPLVNGDQNTEYIGGIGGGYRGGYRGGRGGYRGIDGDRMLFRGGRGGGRGRQFDRISGSDRTGVKPNDKREGFGKGNWGTDQDELTGETEQLTTQEGDKVEEPVPPREKTEEELRLEAEAETLAKQLTLDEFKAQMAARRSEPQFNIRKAGEGTNEKQFGKLVPLARDIVQEPQDEEIVIVRREPRAKRLDIEINFTDEQRGGRGRGGFRGRGARGGRGEGRGSRQNMAFEVSAEAFPALGAQ